MASGLRTAPNCVYHRCVPLESRGSGGCTRTGRNGAMLAVGGKPVRFDSQFVGSGNVLQLFLTSSVSIAGPRGGKFRRWTVPKAVLAEEPIIENEESPQGLEKWVIAAEHGFNTFATEAVVKILETLYAKRLYARFYVLETIARVPYFAFVSVLHMYESFGWWRRADYIKIHFAESWNELHHLLVMEALGGDERWIDRFLAQHIAVAYYFLTVLMYLLSPRMAYHFSECVEKHAFSTYDKFIKSHGDELKLLPAPEVAVQYYTKGDLYMFGTDLASNSEIAVLKHFFLVSVILDKLDHPSLVHFFNVSWLDSEIEVCGCAQFRLQTIIRKASGLSVKVRTDPLLVSRR